VTACAFGAFALLVSLFTRDVTGNMTDHVAVRLQNEKRRDEPSKGDAA